jgi:hypothetical protein
VRYTNLQNSWQLTQYGFFQRGSSSSRTVVSGSGRKSTDVVAGRTSEVVKIGLLRAGGSIAAATRANGMWNCMMEICYVWY